MKMAPTERKVLSREFLATTLKFGPNETSCNAKLADRGVVVENVPTNHEELKNFLKEKNVWFINYEKLSTVDLEILAHSVAVTPYDINFYIYGKLQTISRDGSFRAPIADFNSSKPNEVAADYQIIEWSNGSTKMSLPTLTTLEPTLVVSIFSTEAVKWNRECFRMKKSEKRSFSKVSSFERTRLVLAHGSIEIDGKKIEAPHVFNVDDKVDFIALSDNTAVGHLWI